MMNGTAAHPRDGTQILDVRGELDVTTADALYFRASRVIAAHPQVLLLDLEELSFCDASGLSAFVRIANDADAAGCRYALIAPRPQVAKLLRVTGLQARLPVFATAGYALSHITPAGSDAPALTPPHNGPAAATKRPTLAP